jgi:hypothetical protein
VLSTCCEAGALSSGGVNVLEADAMDISVWAGADALANTLDDSAARIVLIALIDISVIAHTPCILAIHYTLLNSRKQTSCLPLLCVAKNKNRALPIGFYFLNSA